MANTGVTTNVEWSMTRIGTENSEQNFVGTSHNPAYTIDGGRLFLEGYTIKYHVHNHPKNTGPADNDISIRNDIKRKFPNANVQLYRHKAYEDIPGKK